MDFYEPSTTEWERALGELRRRLLGAFGLILLVTLIGIVGFSIIDPTAGLVRAFFMTAITLTTVGYEEEIPLDTDGARIFTAVLILLGMGAVLYFVSAGTAFLLEGRLGHVFWRRRMQRNLASLREHHIVCGSGRTARYAAAELAAVQRPVVLIAGTEEDAERAASELPDVPVVRGDATEDEILLAAGIDRARGLIACTPADNENVVVTLTARQLNPNLRIVVRVQDVDHDKKVRKAGADAVVSPQHIGGLRLASELVRPTVVTFLDTMLRDRELNLRIDEVRIGAEAPVVGLALSEIGLEKLPHVLLLAVRRGEHWLYNPPQSYRIEAGNVLVFLGSPDDARILRESLAG